MVTKEQIDKYFGSDVSKWYDEEYCLEELQKNPDISNLIRCRGLEFWKKASEIYGEYLLHINNPPYELCLAAVIEDGYNISYIQNQNEELCLEAVSHGFDVLEHCKIQTPKIIMEALKHYNRDNYSDVLDVLLKIDFSVLNEDEMQYIKLIIY